MIQIIKVLKMTNSARGTRVHVSDDTTDPPCIVGWHVSPCCLFCNVSWASFLNEVSPGTGQCLNFALVTTHF